MSTDLLKRRLRRAIRLEDETFFSEWFRITWIVRKRMIHEQLGELNELEPMRLDLTPAERAVLQGTEIMKNRSWLADGAKH